MVEKIEIIRGPGSALYGTHAMLAVINVITKGADAIAGTSVAAIAGSQHERGAVLRIGRQLGKDVEMTASGYWQETNGANLYLPEFDAPETNDGLAKGIDYQDFHRFVLTLRRGGLRLSLASRAATKGIPTAMWGTNFNQDEWVMNGQDVATLDYHRALGANKSVELRGYWDHGRSHGLYPYDAIGIDGWDTKTFGGEARLQWDLTPNHRFTAGSEYANVRRLNYWYKVGDYTIELQRPFGVTSYYLQYEGHPSPRWAVVAGIRRDDSSATANSTNPRAAILFTPNRSTTLKLLYGSAFRSPNIYEAYYTDPVTPWKAHPDLAPETIRTTELALEQRLSPTALLEASAFHIDAAHMIDQQLEPVDQVYWYNNVGSMESNGVEAGLNIRRADGLWYRFSGVLQRTLSDGQPASNSPQFLLKGGISTSPWAPWHAGLDGVYEPGRSTRDGEETKAFLLLNGIVSRQMSAHFRLALSSRNLLNTHYSYPVGPELKPQSIRQNGRTFTLKLTYCK
jgi:iron complex outermembrane receptor protein